MSRRTFAIIALVPFLALTGWALLDGGIAGIFAVAASPGGLQVLVDLVIALLLVLTFLVPHARASGRNPWLWVVLTLGLGSIAPLLYFATAADTSAGADTA